MRRSALPTLFVAPSILPCAGATTKSIPCRIRQIRFRTVKASDISTTQTATSTEKSYPYPPTPSLAAEKNRKPFYFETGLALFAKRTPRPFPPPFLSPPSGSFSDPLSTHHNSRDRRAFVNGNLIRGYTNGDDAVYAGNYFIAANDGVGAWSTREMGHAGYALYFIFTRDARNVPTTLLAATRLAGRKPLLIST